jgi:hypothetical protein
MERTKKELFARRALVAFLDNERDVNATDGLAYLVAEDLLNKRAEAGDPGWLENLDELQTAILNYCIEQEELADDC